MEDTRSENVLTEIEENFQDIVNKEDDERLDEAELLEDFDVVDSWEVGGADDVHSVDEPSRKSERRSRGSSYTRRKNDKSSRKDSSHDNYRSRKTSHKRPHSRSNSKPMDHRRSPKKLGDVKTNDKHSTEHLREPTPGSSQKVEKLPDLKCTTSVETGEVNVVLLSEDKIAFDHFDEKEALEDDESHKKHPLLLKNPFAFARLRRKHSQSPDKIRVKDSSLSPRYRTEKYRRESRVVGSRNKDRSLSPYRPRSKHRASPGFYDRKSNRKSISISPERYAGRRTSDHRTREGGRWYGRSREGSVLSRVSSKSSLSFISSDEMSPRDHDRKRSPLWPKAYTQRPKGKSHSHNPINENFMSSSEDFDHKLSLLLKEGKQKQSFTNDSPACTPSEYPSANWRQTEWTNPNTSQASNDNYSCDTTVKPDYNTNVHHNAYPGFSQDQYNQPTYYNNSQPTNYLSNYSGDSTNAVQPPYNYGNQYQNQIPNQYYPQTTAANVTVPAPYTNPANMAQFQPVDQQQPPAVTEVIVQPMVNTSHQSYAMGGDQMNYVGVEPPLVRVQESMQAESAKDQHAADTTDWTKYNRRRVPIRTNIPLTSEENLKEEDPMRTPPPPVISDTWREIESGGKKLSSLLEEASKKREVIARCEEMLQKMLSNDPVMERFKITLCENMQHFSLKEEPKPIAELKSRNAIRAARRTAKMKRFQSPLLRKKTNSCLKYVPWLPGDEDICKAESERICESSGQSSVKPPKSILKNSVPVKEEVCATCVAKRDCMVSASTQTEKLVTNEVGVQVEGDWNHYYPDSNYKNSNSSYSAWYR